MMVLVVMLMAVSVGTVEAKQAAKLGGSDFVYTVSGKKKDFINSSKDQSCSYVVYSTVTKGTDCKGASKNFTTKRKVKEGSTEAFVKKKYGSQKKKKITSKTGFYKGVKYDEPQIDTSSWKSYLAYGYKKGKDSYKLVFCLNKKNKVSGIIYMKNASKLTQYPNKAINMGIKFEAPEGKKVTTKKIGGKKVYMIPKGTKVYYDEKKASANGGVDCSYRQYDVYGNLKASSDTDAPPTGKLEDAVKWCYLWDSKKGAPKEKNGEIQWIDMEKLGKYRYFTLRFFQVYCPEGQKELAPQIVYFKFV